MENGKIIRCWRSYIRRIHDDILLFYILRLFRQVLPKTSNQLSKSYYLQIQKKNKGYIELKTLKDVLIVNTS